MRTVSDALAKPRITFIHFGWLVLGATLGLSLIGVHAIELASGDGETFSAIARRQALFLVVGVVAAVVSAAARPRLLAALAWPAMGLVIAALVFLVLPFIPASIVSPRNGARCWINLGFTDVQPSEFGKIAYVMILSLYLSRRGTYRTLLGLLPPALLTAIPMGLILLQPDLGTAMLFVPTLLAMLVAAGARMWHLVAGCSLGVAFIAVVVGWSLWAARSDEYPLLKKYQVQRLQAVLDPAEARSDRLTSDRGFQGRQAVMVAGSGGVVGHDPDRSRALVRFSGLPERHNDMVFAVVVNRFGLVGALSVVGLYMAWITGALLTAAWSKDPFARLMVVGLAAMVGTQMTINIGMNIGVLPITGITLPFISYGGSSLISGWIMVGIIVGVAMRRPPWLWRESFEFDEIVE
jgi:cell division protein FtsW (lipid II flippase)